MKWLKKQILLFYTLFSVLLNGFTWTPSGVPCGGLMKCKINRKQCLCERKEGRVKPDMNIPDWPEHSDGSRTMTSARTLVDRPIPKAARTATASVAYTHNHSGCFCTKRAVTPYRDANSSPKANATRLRPPSKRWPLTFLQLLRWEHPADLKSVTWHQHGGQMCLLKFCS